VTVTTYRRQPGDSSIATGRFVTLSTNGDGLAILLFFLQKTPLISAKNGVLRLLSPPPGDSGDNGDSSAIRQICLVFRRAPMSGRKTLLCWLNKLSAQPPAWLRPRWMGAVESSVIRQPVGSATPVHLWRI